MIQYAMPALSEDEVKRIADGVFRAVLGDAAAPAVTVEARENFDGDPSYFVRAIIPDGASRPEAKVQMRLQRELSGALVARGELRFPYIRVLTAAGLADLESDAENSFDA